MANLKFVSAQRIRLKDNREVTEKMIQEFISENPHSLGLGEIILKDKERRQQRAGILDLMFEDEDNERRFEVEIQLGETDPSHIVRTLEYWDFERRRYPKYKHCAVLVAEDITSRFLNVISLFNGVIPFIAIQMSAFRNTDQSLALAFTTVLNELEQGADDEDNIVAQKVTRDEWDAKSSRDSMKIVDEVFGLVKQIDSSATLNYTRTYVGIMLSGKAANFVVFKPRKQSVRMEIFLKFSDEMTSKIDSFKLDRQTYNSNFGYYPVSLKSTELEIQKDNLLTLLKLAYQRRVFD